MKRNKQSEKDTEAYLCEQVETVLKGIAYKFSSPNRRSVPDRLCILPEGVHFFVEIKSEGKDPSPAQVREINRIAKMQHPVWVARTKRQVDEVITVVQKTIEQRKMPKKEEPLIIIP